MASEQKTLGQDTPARVAPAKVAPAIPFWRREEFLIAVAVGLFGAWVLYLTTTFRQVPPMLSPGLLPQQFPQLLVCVLFLLCLILFVQSLSTAPKPKTKIPPIVYYSVGMIVLFCVLATVDLFLGFSIFFIGLALLWGERRVVPMVAVALLLPLGIFLLFDLVLEVRFPRGLLTSIYYDW